MGANFVKWKAMFGYKFMLKLNCSKQCKCTSTVLFYKKVELSQWFEPVNIQPGLKALCAPLIRGLMCSFNSRFDGETFYIYIYSLGWAEVQENSKKKHKVELAH